MKHEDHDESDMASNLRSSGAKTKDGPNEPGRIEEVGFDESREGQTTTDAAVIFSRQSHESNAEMKNVALKSLNAHLFEVVSPKSISNPSTTYKRRKKAASGILSP